MLHMGSKVISKRCAYHDCKNGLDKPKIKKIMGLTYVYSDLLNLLLDELVKIGFSCPGKSQKGFFLGTIVPCRSSHDRVRDHETVYVRNYAIKFVNLTEMVISDNAPLLTCDIFGEDLFKLFKLIDNAAFNDQKTCKIQRDQLSTLVSILRDIGYEKQGYNKSIDLTRKATITLMLSLKDKLNHDLIRLLGQYLYSTRYERSTWISK